MEPRIVPVLCGGSRSIKESGPHGDGPSTKPKVILKRIISSHNNNNCSRRISRAHKATHITMFTLIVSSIVIGAIGPFYTVSSSSASALSLSSSYPYSISNATFNSHKSPYSHYSQSGPSSSSSSSSQSYASHGSLRQCLPNPCANGGECLFNSHFKPYCRCPPKFAGSQCQYANPCYGTNRCLNGGTCQTTTPPNSTPTFKCLCPLGFTASLCEVDEPNVCLKRSPCSNGGRCQLKNDLDSYECVCASGWRGPNCDERDNCASQPCKNGAICRSHSNGTGYSCECSPGFRGSLCQEDIDECAAMSSDVACHHNGVCLNTPGSYRCNCEKGYTGAFCESRYVPCEPQNPCQNHGDCVPEYNTSTYQCVCPRGFTGRDCEINIDDCGGHLCQNGGSCVDGVNSYNCRCPTNFTGPYCSQDVDECALRPHVCLNGATCSNTIGGFNCICVNGWTGPTCAENIDDCADAPCFNGATCHDRVGSFYCQCPAGKTGLLCHLDDACASNPCHAGAICDTSPVDGTYICSCPPGFKGTDCTQDIDECHDSGSPCEHGGQCVNTPGSFRCDCALGFAGARCEVNINECDSNPCQNDGTCLDERGSYRCVCMPGYTGIHCETNIDECQSNPCQNGAICSDLINGYRCLCMMGYEGTNCERSVDQCFQNPCRNGAQCEDLIGRYKCHCSPGYRGNHCETEIDECLSNPCTNGGICEDRLNNFHCTCPPGYHGARCEVFRNDCSSNPCYNGGECINSENGYVCRCIPGYSGRNCQDNVDLCNKVTCYNGGSCINQGYSYRCLCTLDYTGFHCEKSSIPSQGQDYDQRDKNKRKDPWINCPNAEFCYNHFSDKICHEECNTRECLFDGFDCRAPEGGGNGHDSGNEPGDGNGHRGTSNGDKGGGSTNSGSNGGSGGANGNGKYGQGMFSSCNELYDQYCALNYANGHCDYGCDNAECAWDGLDCEDERSPLDTDNLRGDLILSIDKPLNKLNGTFDPSDQPPLVKRLLRQLSTLIGSVLRLREIRSNGQYGTKLVLGIDNRKCGEQCFESSREVASFLSASQSRKTTPIESMLNTYGLRMQVDSTDDEQEIMVRPGSQVPNLTFIVLGIMTLLFVGILLGVLVTNNRKKVARGITWFPEGFFSNQMTSPISRSSSRHHPYNNEQSNFGRRQRVQGGTLAHSNSIRSGCPDGQEMRQFKSREDLLDEKSACAAIYEEPTECRSWSTAHYEAFQPHESLTPPLPTPSLDAIGPNGLTPLMVASAYPNMMTVDNPDTCGDTNNSLQDLLMNGANVSLTCDKTSETSLHLAARYARADAAKRLIDHGADVNAQDATGRTPLHTAIASDARGVFEILLRNRTANLNARSHDGTTPLILAGRLANEGMLEQLVASDCDLNGSDDCSKTALHWAASVNNVDGVRYLLQHGADRDAKNSKEETPLFLAAREGAYQCAKLLLDHHANRDITDHMDRLPRDVALERMHSDIVSLLDEHKPQPIPPPQSQSNNSNNSALSPTSNQWNGGGGGGGTLGRSTLQRRKAASQHQHQLSQLSQKLPPLPLPLPSQPQPILLLSSGVLVDQSQNNQMSGHQQQSLSQPPPIYTGTISHQSQLSQLSQLSQQQQHHHHHHHQSQLSQLSQQPQSQSQQQSQQQTQPQTPQPQVTSPFYDFSPPNSMLTSSAMISPPSRPPPPYEDCFKQQHHQQQQQHQHQQHPHQQHQHQQPPIAVAPRHIMSSQGQPPTPTATTAPNLASVGYGNGTNGTLLRWPTTGTGTTTTTGAQQHLPQQAQQQSAICQQQAQQAQQQQQQMFHGPPDSYPTPSPESWGSLSTSSPLSAHDWTMNVSNGAGIGMESAASGGMGFGGMASMPGATLTMSMANTGSSLVMGSAAAAGAAGHNTTTLCQPIAGQTTTMMLMSPNSSNLVQSSGVTGSTNSRFPSSAQQAVFI